MSHGLPKGGQGGEKTARDAAELQLVLSAFGPNPDWHHHESGYLYSDGVQYLAEQAGAYWLLDLIFARQRKTKKDPKLRYTQVWILRVAGTTGILTCYRGPHDPAFSIPLPAIDFPFPEITLHLDDDTLLLPSEH
jgi:hypothetical protein